MIELGGLDAQEKDILAGLKSRKKRLISLSNFN